jgi:hypothetical protein
MSRRTVLSAFKQIVEPELKRRGFRGRRGHFVTSEKGVTRVVELQHSIYGGRLTANLGLNLDVLKPLVRWIDAPDVGPHAHDSTRWIRIGLVRPDHVDCWWSFSTDSEDGAEEAARGLGRAIIDHGLPWLDRESTPAAFLRFAEGKLERSISIERPHGSYLDLRLLAAVLAWNGDFGRAKLLAARARESWSEEQRRLVEARDDYRRKNPQLGNRIAPVPDIQAELDQLISTTTVSSKPASDPRAQRRRSKSARLRSTPA